MPFDDSHRSGLNRRDAECKEPSRRAPLGGFGLYDVVEYESKVEYEFAKALDARRGIPMNRIACPPTSK